MRHISIIIAGLTLLLVCACGGPPKDIPLAAGNDEQTVVAVNANHFLAGGLAEPVGTVDCTLSDGTSGKCYRITINNTPADHRMGPWCPETINDDASAGGIWLENGEVYDVDGAFIKNMAAFYDDDTWRMYDDAGKIYVTRTKEDCANAANPNVGEEYRNFCVECLPSFVENLTQTFLIPVTPRRVNTATQFVRGRRAGVSVRGLALNGVRFDAPAPTDAILGAYTLAPFDDAGGHINPNAGYHYHAATGMTTSIKQPDGHAGLIGYALDGHGIYERLDAEGNEPEGLDPCRGHYDDVRGYHYHVDAAGKNNFLNCLGGVYAEE